MHQRLVQVVRPCPRSGGPASPGPRRATGFAFCGMVEEPPPAPAVTSPTSDWPSRMMSWPILPRVPVTAPASRRARPCRRARRARDLATARGRARRRARASPPPRARQRRVGARRPGERHPEQPRTQLRQPLRGGGSAACTRPRSWPRAWSAWRSATGSAPRSACLVPRCLLAERRISRASRASRRRGPAPAASTSAVSTISWLVAPQWTQPRCSASSRARNAATSAATGTPAAAMPDGESRRGRSRPRAAARSIARALAAGMMPSSPWTRASAPSTLSIARTSAAPREQRGDLGVAVEAGGQRGVERGDRHQAGREAEDRAGLRPGSRPAARTSRRARPRGAPARRSTARVGRGRGAGCPRARCGCGRPPRSTTR